MKTSEFEKYYNVIADLNNETAEKRQKMKEIIEKNENEITPHSFNSKLSLISIQVSEDLIKPLWINMRQTKEFCLDFNRKILPGFSSIVFFPVQYQTEPLAARASPRVSGQLLRLKSSWEKQYVKTHTK